MLCKNCGINEREASFGWCSACLDDPNNRRQPKEPKERKETPKPKQMLPATYQRMVNTMARRVFEHFHGPIPEGHHIHHKDKDKLNLCKDNLMCLSTEEHIRLHEDQGDDQAVSILKRTFRK